MATPATSTQSVKTSEDVIKKPESLTIAAHGIKSSEDFAKLMSGLMVDLITGTVNASVGNAVCNAGGKLLRVVELQIRYGTPDGGKKPRKSLTLVTEEE